ncbi:Lrp/AsnC family transcriptional regulator [Limnovirga soli]|uniref:Winged helix-turn-helix transcriptional regulator n=1 Tax=Limnovirga soli TaxID=2656915 RepID=A0A8J8FHL3_9BACT|nr:Lrp/AsnC family transcriptional regulator [Limnovirga soli]NNV57323.1 winged helix-turn-helix transcriptional regulator [Limnovirga soli]
MDELDFLILRELQQDGGMSLTIIAKNLDVSIGTIRNRMAKLLEDNTVQIIGRIDPNKVGFHAYARIFISVKPAKLIQEAAEKLSLFPEVSFLAMISGKYDLELNVQCRDNNHLIELMERIHPLEGVFETETNMYLKVFKIAQPDLDLVKDLWVK